MSHLPRKMLRVSVDSDGFNMYLTRLTHLALLQVGDQLGTRAVAGIYRGEPQLRRATELCERNQAGIELDFLVTRAVVIWGHEHPVEVRRRDRAGEKVRSLIVFPENLHGVNVAILPVDEPLRHLGCVHATQKCREIGGTGTQIGSQGARYRFHQPLVF